MAGMVVGWRVTPGGDPIYWLGPNPRSGSQAENDLVAIRPKDMATHSLIVAQSGSGKSFFLGRLIEELLLHTRAKCVIFDPNADFGRVDTVQDAGMWTHAAYDRVAPGA